MARTLPIICAQSVHAPHITPFVTHYRCACVCEPSRSPVPGCAVSGQGHQDLGRQCVAGVPRLPGFDVEGGGRPGACLRLPVAALRRDVHRHARGLQARDGVRGRTCLCVATVPPTPWPIVHCHLRMWATCSGTVCLVIRQTLDSCSGNVRLAYDWCNGLGCTQEWLKSYCTWA